MNRDPLRASNLDAFGELIENVGDVFWICSADTGTVLYVSPAYKGVWGKAPDALYSEKGAWPEAVLDGDREIVLKARSRLAAGESYDVEYRILRPDHSVRWIHDRGYPVPGKDGRQARAVGVACDVTERKRAAAEVVQAHKMEFMGKIAGGIAHDFNNLLTIISGYSSMLLEDPSLPPASSDALKRVFTASLQATGLVRQLLLFSRKRSPKLEVIDLNAEIEQIAGMVRRVLGETVVVDFKRSPDSPRVNADAGMLEQLLMNLAMNAREVMARNGRLVIAVGPGRREGGSAREPGPAGDGDYTCISVRDSGRGIPAAALPRIFEPFFATKEEGRGAGLGLTTAQDIVKRHGGWIEVETGAGAGTEFRIHLPLVRAGAASSAKQGRGETPRAGKATLLLVEDDDGVREFAAAVLRQEGYTLLQATSGEGAMEVWQWHSARIDLLLSDVVLPGELSGPQLGARMQADKPALRVVLTTGFTPEAVAPAEAGVPARAFLSKPYTPSVLLQAVHDALA